MTWTLKNDLGGFQVRWSSDTAAKYRAEGYWRDETLADVARRAVQEEPEKVLVIEGATKLTRKAAWDQSLRLAAFMLSRGLKPGDVVSFQLPNWIEASIISLAARMIGVVVNPIPPIYRDSEADYILADCGTKMIFIPRLYRNHDHYAMIERLRHKLPSLRDVIVVRGENTAEFSWEDALALPPAVDSDLPVVDAASVMMVMYTSGTTGRPKGVLHNHYSYDYRVRSMAEAWMIGPEDVVFMPSPVTHITGAFWVFDMPWVSGSASVLIDTWTANDGIRCIETNCCTVSGGATPFLQQLLETAKSKPEALASLRLFFCGGTTVSPDIIREATDTFPNGLFFRVYGSTEQPCTTLGIHDRYQSQLGAETDGEVIYPTEVKIVESAAVGEEGEIVCRGPEQFIGYRLPADNADAFDEEGYFRTGDLGRWVHNNFLTIIGRKKDIIIRSGENISPKEIEDQLFTHPAVVEAAIVAMPSATTGEKACAFIIPREGQVIDLPEIKRFLDAAGFARQKIPEHIVLVDDLPRVPSGKVRKDVLRIRAKEISEERST